MDVLLISLLIFLVLGIPIAYSLGLSAFSYFLIYHPELLQILPQRFFAGLNLYALIALPLFIFMGLLMNQSGITARLIDFSLIFVGRLRGGLGLVNVFASMIFGGISGSSASDTASIGSVLIPEMEKRGYPKRFASGLTVASSTMGMIIPPSIPMVLYAIVAEESVGKLFLGGLIPGLMIGIFQLGITMIISIRNNYPKEEINFHLIDEEIIIEDIIEVDKGPEVDQQEDEEQSSQEDVEEEHEEIIFPSGEISLTSSPESFNAKLDSYL